MGKRIDELTDLDDTPLGGEKGGINELSPDPRATDWYRFSTDIEDLLATGHYTWAETSLRAIQTTVEQTHRVTGGQRQAVSNIERARREDGSRPFGRRRYEGFR